ncbi:hypothetical protein SPRG_19458 [Saprolegnia parasitica CBS 223.65]|uniref:Uncharacterized protein n=1 Tax=Saprolegnia parasitica (strain CBS 223.65) TaxID=695850 RepID=A0A067CTF1_SAPPC|nr:hypothetical protein SPRG_19458 [Saprolegnia parasitica CBS 223.65]KDO32530.1 hypothetical protein SPRG_19458 [Saprolegnia parasitica CBS 223.65]|eukprot:XP_012197063.1 hypothetical protein SPRG_19458 [Saprolegnia parasitica CBS 223.65]
MEHATQGYCFQDLLQMEVVRGCAEVACSGLKWLYLLHMCFIVVHLTYEAVPHAAKAACRRSSRGHLVKYITRCSWLSR